MTTSFLNRLFVAAVISALSYAVVDATGLFSRCCVGETESSIGELGVWMPAGCDGEFFVPTDAAPLVPDVSFGWQLAIPEGDPSAVRVLTETLVLPEPPEQWIVGPNTTISPDRKRATTTIVLDHESAVYEQAWGILEGDPPGRYRFHVTLDGETLLRDSLLFVEE